MSSESKNTQLGSKNETIQEDKKGIWSGHEEGRSRLFGVIITTTKTQ